MSTINLDAADLAGNLENGVINEDVMQRIFDISNINLPFTDAIGSSRHTNQEFSWTVDRLQAADTSNAQIDGFEVTDFDASNQNTQLRVYNHSQISTKELEVSTRAQAVNTIGFANALAYQVMMRGNELRRDVEAMAMLNNTAVAGTTSVAGEAGGLEAWLADENVLGTATAYTASVLSAGTATIGGWPNRTASTTLVPAIDYTTTTPGPLTEDAIKDVIEVLYTGGAMPTIGMTRPPTLRLWSEFQFSSNARISTLQAERDGAVDRVAQGAVNVFHTDFGVTLRMIPNRLQPTSGESGTEADTLFIMDPSQIELSFLSGYTTVPLAKTGLYDRRQIFVDWSLKVLSWETLGAVIGIDRTAPMSAS